MFSQRSQPLPEDAAQKTRELAEALYPLEAWQEIEPHIFMADSPESKIKGWYLKRNSYRPAF